MPSPKPAKPTIAKEAHDLVGRRPGPGRPPTPKPEPATPTLAAPGPPAPWETFGPILHKITTPGYRALGAIAPPEEAWTFFAVAWGRVWDYYLPVLKDTPWPPAIVATGLIALPVAQALPSYLERRKGKPAPPPTSGRDDGAPAAAPARPPSDTPDPSTFLGGAL